MYPVDCTARISQLKSQQPVNAFWPKEVRFRAIFLQAAPGRCLPVVALLIAATSAAQDRPVSSAPVMMSLSIGRSVVLDRSAAVTRISISNPDVVDAVAVTTREILINAKAPGLSSLVIWSKNGERTMYAVTVDRDLEPIRRLLKETFPDEAIDVRADRDSLALVGHVSNPAIAERAIALIAPQVKAVVNNLQVVPTARRKADPVAGEICGSRPHGSQFIRRQPVVYGRPKHARQHRYATIRRRYPFCGQRRHW